MLCTAWKQQNLEGSRTARQNLWINFWEVPTSEILLLAESWFWTILKRNSQNLQILMVWIEPGSSTTLQQACSWHPLDSIDYRFCCVFFLLFYFFWGFSLIYSNCSSLLLSHGSNSTAIIWPSSKKDPYFYEHLKRFVISPASIRVQNDGGCRACNQQIQDPYRLKDVRTDGSALRKELLRSAAK